MSSHSVSTTVMQHKHGRKLLRLIQTIDNKVLTVMI